jgi:ABC-2 type transport system ATP-binding protein
MIIQLTDVAKGSGLGASVPPLTATIAGGAPSVLAVETDERPMLVAMLIGARLRPDSGTITLDGRSDDDQLRTATAIVDAPFVSEPSAGVSLANVVREELSFSDQPTSGRAVSEFLAAHGLTDYARVPVRALPPTTRIRLFAELALLRDGVRCVIVTSPERHGAAPSEWYETLLRISERGIAVLVIADVLTSQALLRLGAQDASAAPAINESSQP